MWRELSVVADEDDSAGAVQAGAQADELDDVAGLVVDDGVEAQTGADGGGTNGAEGSGVVAEAVDGVQRRRSGALKDY